MIRYIDAHCHTHGLPYNTWETLGVSGCAAVVLSVGNPHVYQEIHDEVPDWDVMQHYWNGAIRFAPEAEKKYLIKVFVALGISYMSYWKDWEKAVEELPNYLQKPHVVAIGETGIDPWQYWGFSWPSDDERKEAFRGQIRVAKQMDVPVILHTPTQRPGFMPEVPANEYKRHFLDQDLDIINEVGLDHQRVVVDHADETIIEYVLKETNAYIGIGVGATIRPTTPSFFADIVQEFGPDRLIINTDHMAELECDILAVPKAIREMRLRGLNDDVIGQVVFENANKCFSLGM